MENSSTFIDDLKGSDYFYFSEEIGNLVNCTSEPAIIKMIFKLFNKLIMPRQIVLIDFSRDENGKATYYNSLDTENLDKDAYDSFTINIVHRNIVHGVFEFYGVKFPENIEMYKKRGAVICSIFSAAISNARKYEIIEFQKRQLQEYTNNLTEMIHTKDKFFSIIAHDLRGPFGNFLGLTTLLADDFSRFSTEQIRNMTIKMKSNAISLFGLLENLLEWTRSQQGLIYFNPEKLYLLAEMKENVVLLNQTFFKKNIRIILNIPSELLVYADLKMLQTILRNLISNGYKFTPVGGKIVISAKNCDDGLVKISIQDTGIGIPEKMLPNLFSVTVKTNRNGTDGEPSSGLGLILCKDFIEKNGGRIWVESDENKGSTFYFTLPKWKPIVPIENQAN